MPFPSWKKSKPRCWKKNSRTPITRLQITKASTMLPMTMRERMMAVYRKRSPIGCPCRFTNDICRQEKRNGWCATWHRISDYYPPVTLLAPPWHTSPGYVSEVRGADLQIRMSWENGEMVETRTYETPVGAVYQETTRDPNYGSDWVAGISSKTSMITRPCSTSSRTRSSARTIERSAPHVRSGQRRGRAGKTGSLPVPKIVDGTGGTGAVLRIWEANPVP